MKANINKFILLCLVLVLGCFGDEIQNLETKISQERAQKITEDSRTGWFFGAGAGGGVETLKAIQFGNKPTLKDDFALFVASTQIGGYHYFNAWTGIRYYYSLDFSLDTGKDKYSSSQFTYTAKGLGGYAIFYHHMLNLDFIFNLYASPTLDFGIILGIGGGITKVQYAQKNYGFYSTKLISFGSSVWDIQAKVGMRLLLDRKQGVELIAKTMPLNQLIIEGAEYGGKLFRQSSYVLMLNFVVEL